MSQKFSSPEPISSESEARCENQSTNSSVTKGSTGSAQPSQAGPLPDGPEDLQHNGQVSEPQGQPAPAPAARETSEKRRLPTG